MTDAEDQPAEPRAAPPGGRDWRRWALRGKRSGLLAAVVAVAVAFGPMALAPWRERTAEVELPPAVADPHPVRVAVAESRAESAGGRGAGRGGADRLRPILSTSVTTTIGLIPLALSDPI